MSYLPIPVSGSVISGKQFAVYSTRVKMNKASVLSTGTLQTFLNPVLYDSVTIAISSTYSNPSANPRFREGDYVVIGTRVGLFKTPSLITGNSITCRIHRMGSWLPGTNVPVPGQQNGTSQFLTKLGNSNLIKTATTIDSIQNAANGSFMTWALNSFSGIPTNDLVSIGTHAGTFLITNVDAVANTMTIKKIADGDVPAGQTIPVGVKISSGHLLGITRNHSITSQFIPTESYAAVYYKDPLNTSTNTPTVGIGWGANSDSGRDPFCESFGVGSSGAGTVPGASGASSGKYRSMLISTSTDNQRLGIPAGHALMCCVRTKTSLDYDYILEISVRGFYTE